MSDINLLADAIKSSIASGKILSMKGIPSVDRLEEIKKLIHEAGELVGVSMKTSATSETMIVDEESLQENDQYEDYHFDPPFTIYFGSEEVVNNVGKM